MTKTTSACVFTAPVMIVWHDGRVTVRQLWWQVRGWEDVRHCLMSPLVTMRADWSLTNHQRLGAPVSSPGARSSLDALRPGCCARTARAGSGPALAHQQPPSRHNKLDFSSFRGEKRRAWACGESSKCYAHVTKTDRDSPDIWRHLEPSVIRGTFQEWRMDGRILSNISTMPPPIYQSFKPEQRSISQ